MIVSSQNMNILARVAIQNPDLLLDFLRAVEPSHDIVPEFVERWSGPKVVSSRNIADHSSILLDKRRVGNSTPWVLPRYYVPMIPRCFPILALL